MTGLVIVITGAYADPEAGEGIAMTSWAFGSVFGWFPYLLSLTAVLFAGVKGPIEKRLLEATEPVSLKDGVSQLGLCSLAFLGMGDETGKPWTGPPTGPGPGPPTSP